MRGLEGYTYEKRPIEFLGTGQGPGDWHVKAYSITVAGDCAFLPAGAVEAARRMATAILIEPSALADSHGVAILTMHLGLQGFWVLLDWWAHGDSLMHRHFRAPVEEPAALTDVSAEGFGPCVWELAVQAYEREAWLRHVLLRTETPDLGGYLGDGLSARV